MSQPDRLAEVVIPQELSDADLEQIVGGKDGNYGPRGLISVTSGREAVEAARRHPSPEIVHGHIR
jgi:hypothetical protein